MVKTLPKIGQAVTNEPFIVNWSRLCYVRGALAIISVISIIF